MSSGAGERAQEAVLTVALEPGEADELARAQLEPRGGEHDLRGRAMGALRRLRREVVAAGHQPHELVSGRRTALERRHGLTGPHDRAAIADLGDLVHPMRDEDHRGAGFGALPQELEQAVARGDVEGRGGLVEDEDARVAHQRAGEAARLPLAEGQPLRRRVERRRLAEERVEYLLRPPALLCGGDTAGEHAVGPHPDVLQHRARFDDKYLLEDGGDAGRRGAPRRAEVRHGLRFELERAGVGPVNAGEDLHERGLAGPVLADDAVHLTAAQLE